jgi:hypothetical protein
MDPSTHHIIALTHIEDNDMGKLNAYNFLAVILSLALILTGLAVMTFFFYVYRDYVSLLVSRESKADAIIVCTVWILGVVSLVTVLSTKTVSYKRQAEFYYKMVDRTHELVLEHDEIGLQERQYEIEHHYS